MNAAPGDDFYADQLTLGRNAQSAGERRITRNAAMSVWSAEDIASVTRDETGAAWGWTLERYRG